MFRLSRALDFPFQKDKHYTRFVLAGFMKNPSINCDMHQHVESGCQSFPDALLSLTEQYLENGIVPHRGNYQWKIVLNDIFEIYGGIESDKFEIGGIVWILKASRYMDKNTLSVKLQPDHAPDEFVNVGACAKLCFVETNDFFVYPFDLNFDGFKIALDHRIDLSEIENPIYLTVLIHIQILRIQNSESLIFNYSNWPSTAHTFKWAIDEPLIKKIISCHNKLRRIFSYSEHNVYSPIFNNFWNVYINCESLSIHCQACAFPKNRILSAMYTEGGTVLTAQFPDARIFGKIYIEELDIQCTFDENVFLIEQLKQLKQLTIHFCDIRIEIIKLEMENKSQEVKKYQVYLENMKTIKEVENSSNKRIIKKSRKRKYEEMNDIHQIPMNNSDTKRIKQLTLTKH